MLNIMNSQIISTTDLIGTCVINKDWERVVTIHSLVRDRKSGDILYALLSFGGLWWGSENKYIAVPLKAFEYEVTSDTRIVLDVKREELENAPTLDKNSWPLEPTDELLQSVLFR